MFNHYNRDSNNSKPQPSNTSRICEWPLPARLNMAEAGQILGFQEHDMPILIAARLLEPLGKPVSNAPKYFAVCEIRELAQNPEWLCRATQTVYNYWKGKNLRKVSSPSQSKSADTEISRVE